MTIDEAIKILRQHNITGVSVLRITNGRALEKDLLAQVLNACESLMTERTEYKRLLKAAVEDIVWLNEHTIDGEGGCLIETATDMETCLACPLNVNNSHICGWKHQVEALKFIEKGEQNCGR